MNVLGYTAYGRDFCTRAILCPRQVSHFYRSWFIHQRCTANLVGCSMLLSVHMPTVDTMRKTTGLETPGEDFQGHDGIDWYGVYGTDCRGGGENVTTGERIRWQQSLKESNCTVTSTRANSDSRGVCHTWRAWGSQKQIDLFMGRRDLYSSTRYLNKIGLGYLGPLPVRIEGKEQVRPTLAIPILAKPALKGGGPKPRKGGGAPKGGRPKISRFFFPFPPSFRSFCVSLGAFSWNFGGV